MPRKTPKTRKSAGTSPIVRPSARKVAPKQAHDRQNLARRGRGSTQTIRPLKFPGKLGGR